MQRLFPGRSPSRSRPIHAFTDLYDEDRRTILVRYPTWLIIILSLGGMLAFAVTGFLGYGTRAHPTRTYFLFGDPWVLAGWLFTLMFVLEISIFRHPSLRWRRNIIVAVTTVCILLVGYAYFNLPFLRELLSQSSEQPPPTTGGGGLVHRLLNSPWTYSIINFGILAIFWADTARRWIRRGMGLSPNPEVDLGLGEARKRDLPSMEEVISGDLIAAGVLSLILMLAFSPWLINFVGGILTPTRVPIDQCLISLPGSCPPSPSSTLAFLDTVLALITLPLGAIILALTATLSGLGAVGGVNAGSASGALSTAHAPSEGARVVVSEEVSLTVLNTLKSALDRRIRIALIAVLVSLRNVVWPLLVLVATISLGATSLFIQAYLQSDKSAFHLLIFMLPAFILGLLAVLCTIFASATYLFKMRVTVNSLQFLGLVGFVVLLTFWIFSLALSAFNLLFLKTDITQRTPFWPPNVSTYLSLAALLVYGAIALTRYNRNRRAGASGTTSA